jgi:manganese transport protein
VIAGFVGVIGACYLAELYYAHPRSARSAAHAVSRVPGQRVVLLAVGILGATVMPHVIYLHSALTQNRDRPRERRRGAPLYRYTQIDVVDRDVDRRLINLAMLVMAASTFFRSGLHDVDSLETPTKTLEPFLGKSASVDAVSRSPCSGSVPVELEPSARCRGHRSLDARASSRVARSPALGQRTRRR